MNAQLEPSVGGAVGQSGSAQPAQPSWVQTPRRQAYTQGQGLPEVQLFPSDVHAPPRTGPLAGQPCPPLPEAPPLADVPPAPAPPPVLPELEQAANTTSNGQKTPARLMYENESTLHAIRKPARGQCARRLSLCQWHRTRAALSLGNVSTIR